MSAEHFDSSKVILRICSICYKLNSAPLMASIDIVLEIKNRAFIIKSAIDNWPSVYVKLSGSKWNSESIYSSTDRELKAIHCWGGGGGTNNRSKEMTYL